MTDYGHPLSFGLSLDPTVDAQPGHLETWTLISHLSSVTHRISFLTDVADLQLRPPTMLAKAAASLNILTEGRIQLGVGGGAFADAIASMGGLPRRGAQMVAFTEESLHLMHQALSGGVVRMQTPHHAVTGYRAGPVASARVRLWLGAQKPKMLNVTGRAADGWISPLNIYVPPEEVPARQQIIDDAATAAGRDPRSIRRIYNVIGTIGAHGAGPGLVGDVQEWADTLGDWALRLGFDTFIFWPTGDAEKQLEVFASHVVPAVRARVAAARGQR
ncbi:LLM class flavin-dependent oxidoreductase [Streptomyces nigra]|uniref:LLM class flavin-dependent oxidoreductase n=1 Tax=Streptomyces nigra TaxID=1827580 RepID=UPI0035E21510